MIMPPDNFWDGIGTAVSHASGEIVCTLIAAVAVCFIIVKYYIPERREQKQFDAEMRQKQMELEVKRQQDAVDVQRENIESRAKQTEILSELSDSNKALVASQQALQTQVAVAIAKLEDSKANSAKMSTILSQTSGDVTDIKSMTQDIHKVLYHPDVVD